MCCRKAQRFTHPPYKLCSRRDTPSGHLNMMGTQRCAALRSSAFRRVGLSRQQAQANNWTRGGKNAGPAHESKPANGEYDETQYKVGDRGMCERAFFALPAMSAPISVFPKDLGNLLA